MSKIMVYRGRGRVVVEEHLKMLKWQVQEEVHLNIEQTKFLKIFLVLRCKL
jgi:hypothetical protein